MIAPLLPDRDRSAPLPDNPTVCPPDEWAAALRRAYPNLYADRPPDHARRAISRRHRIRILEQRRAEGRALWNPFDITPGDIMSISEDVTEPGNGTGIRTGVRIDQGQPAPKGGEDAHRAA